MRRDFGVGRRSGARLRGWLVSFTGIQEGHIRGRNLHGMEQGRSFFRLDAAVEHQLANLGDG
jgi:hypothetical protein